jgi:hypothetical protein
LAEFAATAAPMRPKHAARTVNDLRNEELPFAFSGLHFMTQSVQPQTAPVSSL